jgi:hypothetical protein
MNCSKCDRTNLTEDDFYPANNVSGREAACKRCRNERKYEKRREKRIEQGLRVKFPTIAARLLLEEGKKFCPRCREIKDIKTEFSTMKVRSGIASHCKLCTTALAKSAPSANPERKRKYYGKYKTRQRDVYLKNKFGISLVQYNDMYQVQKGRCAVCRNKQKGKVLAVDHDHKTGRVRALLCSLCNFAVGAIKDSPELALKMAEYLRVINHRVLTY